MIKNLRRNQKLHFETPFGDLEIILKDIITKEDEKEFLFDLKGYGELSKISLTYKNPDIPEKYNIKIGIIKNTSMNEVKMTFYLPLDKENYRWLRGEL